MPYKGEYATGDSLWRLEDNPSVKAFKGIIQIREHKREEGLPPEIFPPRRQNDITRIVVVDGSTVTKAVQNGFPMAEAALFNAAAIVIKVDELRKFDRDHIPSPKELREIERVGTLSAVLPGQNVVGTNEEQDTPKKFFRQTIREEFNFSLDEDHESLLETFHAIAADALHEHATFRCPIDDCGDGEPIQLSRKSSDGPCECERGALIYSTDSLRMHERFSDYGTCEQAFTAFRMVTEHLLMMNIIRYFWKVLSPNCFDRTAFVMDGPLAIFGMPAWLKDHLQAEVSRIHNELMRAGRPGLLLMGIEKSGQFKDHLEELDWLKKEGQRQRLTAGTVLVPTTEYVYRHIAPNPNSTKAYGKAVHYGRKLMYKTHTGQHAVLMTPIVNSIGEEPNSTSLDVFPRLGDALDIIDDLFSHLYNDGFIPLMRANAHAAIPLRQGQGILAELFKE